MDPLAQSWVVVAAICPLSLLLSCWCAVVISRGNRCVDSSFVKTILAQSVAGGTLTLASAVIFLLQPSGIFSQIFLCASVTVRTFQLSTAASASLDLVLRRGHREYGPAVGVHHVRYHLVMLLVLSLLVGLAGFYAYNKQDLLVCICLPVNVDTSFRIFLVSLYSLMAATSMVMTTSAAFAKCCEARSEKAVKGSRRTNTVPVVMCTIICNHGPYLVILCAWMSGRWTLLAWLEWAASAAMITQGILLPAVLWLLQQNPTTKHKSSPSRHSDGNGMLFVRADSGNKLRKAESINTIHLMDSSSNYSTMAGMDTDPIYATLTLSLKSKDPDDGADDGASVTTSANDDFEFHKPKRVTQRETTMNRHTSMSANDINLAGLCSRKPLEEIVYVLNDRSESTLSLYRVNLPQCNNLRHHKRVFVSDYI